MSAGGACGECEKAREAHNGGEQEPGSVKHGVCIAEVPPREVCRSIATSGLWERPRAAHGTHEIVGVMRLSQDRLNTPGACLTWIDRGTLAGGSADVLTWDGLGNLPQTQGNQRFHHRQQLNGAPQPGGGGTDDSLFTWLGGEESSGPR